MTREEAKELLPIIQAYADGKAIEYSNNGEDWIGTETPTWNSDYVYRIKSELKYRPFKTQEECWEEMHKHQPFGYLKNMKSNNIVQIASINTVSYGELHFYLSVNGYSFYTADFLFENYAFTDGTQFGIKEE